MNRYIAYCGLNCETCEARLATIWKDTYVYAMTEEDDNSWRLYGNRIQEIGQ